jgi:hypothetical protein
MFFECVALEQTGAQQETKSVMMPITCHILLLLSFANRHPLS